MNTASLNSYFLNFTFIYYICVRLFLMFPNPYPYGDPSPYQGTTVLIAISRDSSIFTLRQAQYDISE